MADDPEHSTAPALERKLATILSADVAEYSRLMAEDEERTLLTFRAHKQIFESLVALHRGRVFNTAGDAILAEFTSAVEAVRCATEIQAALRTRNDQLPPQRQVKFRLGVNLGDVMVQDTDLLGDGVNVAARLQAAAEPGGICISGSVYDQIRNKLSLSFKSLGERSFKNIPQPVRTFSIAEAEGHGELPTPQRTSHGGARSLAKWAAAAVLVFAIAGGYWAYSEFQRGKAEQVRVLAEAENARREAQLAADKAAAELARRQAEADRNRAAAEAQLAADRAAAELARRQAEADRNRATAEARRLADEQRKQEDAARSAPAPAPAQQQASVLPSAPAPAGPAGLDGVYSGPICYGESRIEPARCFRAQAAVSQRRISGQWPARDPGITMFLTGQVSNSGEVRIELRSRTAIGIPMAVINMSGTLRDGRLDATGSFLNGRSVTLNWRHN